MSLQKFYETIYMELHYYYVATEDVLNTNVTAVQVCFWYSLLHTYQRYMTGTTRSCLTLRFTILTSFSTLFKYLILGLSFYIFSIHFMFSISCFNSLGTRCTYHNYLNCRIFTQAVIICASQISQVSNIFSNLLLFLVSFYPNIFFITVPYICMFVCSSSLCKARISPRRYCEVGYSSFYILSLSTSFLLLISDFRKRLVETLHKIVFSEFLHNILS